MQMQYEGRNENRQAGAAVRACLMWTAALSLASVLFCGSGYLLHAPTMYYQAISPPGTHFSDFTIYREKFALFHTTEFFHSFFPFTYPAPVALVYEAFFRIFGRHATNAFVLFSAVAVLLPAGLFFVALRRRGLAGSAAGGVTLVLLFCSWPALLVIDRGNMEILVWIALALATWALATGREYLAASSFGVAASLKLFPFIFLGIFLSKRRYRELAVGCAVFAGVSVASLAVLGPTVAIAGRGIVDGLHFFAIQYMARWNSWENGVDHSLFATIKLMSMVLFHHPPQQPFTRELAVYNASMVTAGVALFFLRIRFLPIVNQVLTLSIASIYFTAFSGDGTLFHLYYPLAMLIFVGIDGTARGVTVAGLKQALCLLAFLLSYEGFFVVHNHRLEGEVKCLALGWLLVVALRYPFGAPLGKAGREDELAWPDTRLIAKPWA